MAIGWSTGRGTSASPSDRPTNAAHVRSPVTFTAVRIMSRIRSTPRISAMPACAWLPMPIDCNTRISMMMPALGTPAVPMLASVAVSTIVD